jgi:hypothetical protein
MDILERGGECVKDFYSHVNDIERVSALLKRHIIGTRYYLTLKHFSRYLGRMTWCFNLRDIGEGDQVSALLDLTSGGQTSKEQIA